jgi:hypothetical protein
MTIVIAPGRRIGPTIAFAIDTTLIGLHVYTGWPKNHVFLALHYASKREIISHKKIKPHRTTLTLPGRSAGPTLAFGINATLIGLHN